MQFDVLNTFYKKQIEEDFFPYWARFVDHEFGGVLNCINNYGDAKLSDDKFTWSQGRWLWVLGNLYELNQTNTFPSISNEALEQQMAAVYTFLQEKSIYGDSICCYVLSRTGEKQKDPLTGRYDASVYADCFALIGMSQYTKVMHQEENLPTLQALYDSIVARIESGHFPTEPYPIPEGYQTHGIPMILVNTVREYAQMRKSFGCPIQAEVDYGRKKLAFILNDLYYADGLIHEHLSTPENASTCKLDRHVNPGHTLEDMWFCIEFLQDFGGLEEYLPRILQISRKTFHQGWDEAHGGLLRFVDYTGGQPKGENNGNAYETLIDGTWDMKLWWPHSEILYLFPLLYSITGQEEWAQLYEKSAAYVFATFPNKELGEWVQIRKRDGTPEEKLVALPVKDPFHILRNFIKIVQLTQDKA